VGLAIRRRRQDHRCDSRQLESDRLLGGAGDIAGDSVVTAVQGRRRGGRVDEVAEVGELDPGAFEAFPSFLEGASPDAEGAHRAT
jgi:hypothetical protein